MSDISYLTKKPCSVFCCIESESDVLEALSSWKGAGADLVQRRDEDGTLVLKICDKGAEFEVFICIRRAPGDKVSKTLMGAYNYFKRIDTEYGHNQQYVLKVISRSNASLGVLAKPQLVEECGHYNYILSLARRFEGLVFNGSGLVNELGEVVLNNRGECSVTMGKA